MRLFNLNYMKGFDHSLDEHWIPSIIVLHAWLIQHRDKNGKAPYTHIFTWTEYLEGAADYCYYSGLRDEYHTNNFPYGRVTNADKRYVGREPLDLT